MAWVWRAGGSSDLPPPLQVLSLQRPVTLHSTIEGGDP